MSNSSSSFYLTRCLDPLAAVYVATAYIITKCLLFLPLCVYVLHLAHRQWWQQRSFAATSHSDIFTFHAVAFELIYVFGSCVYFCGRYTFHSEVMFAGVYMSSLILPGQMCLHVLTCVERYLAVVHPVLYLKLKRSGGIRIRNISTVCVWLFAVTWVTLLAFWVSFPYTQFFCLLGVAFTVVFFCSLRVLCVLIRPGPGEVGGTRDRVDQSKQKAFYTILAIMLSLCLWFVACLVGLAMDDSSLLDDETGCLVLFSTYWCSLPSNFVSPLLFLQRAGKLTCCH